MVMSDYDVIVIGAGCGGLTAGALLAAQGRSVLVLEQSGRIGGSCSSYEKDGFTFDVGAAIVEVIQPIEAVFRMLGTTFQEEVPLVASDPIFTYILEDGSRITYPQSIEATAEVIERISPEDAASWKAFTKYFSEFYDMVIDTFFTSPANTLGDFLKMFSARPRILKYLPLFAGNYEDVVKKYFSHPRIQQTIAYQSNYFNLPPVLTPAIFGMLAYAEHLGTYYPEGGMIAIPQGLQRCGKRYGMELRLDARVQKVTVRGRRVGGVTLSSGEQVTCDVLVSNINCRTLYLDMIGEEHVPRLARFGLNSYKLSGSDCVLNLGLDYEPPLDTHFTALATSVETMNRENFERDRGILHDEKHGLICWSSRSDPSLAPEGKHSLGFIMEGPYRLQGSDWNRERQPVMDKTIAWLDRLVPGLSDHIVTADILTPYDFEERLLLPEGAIYSFELDLGSSAVFRPSAKSKFIDGLYLTGNSTHPGGGVPVVIGSGLIAAELIDRHER